MTWTEEQEEILMNLVKEGMDVNSTSERMIEMGFSDRSPRSVRAKYRAMTGQSWPAGKPAGKPAIEQDWDNAANDLVDFADSGYQTGIEVEKNEEVILEEVKIHLEETKTKNNIGKYILIGFLSLILGGVTYWWIY